MDWLLNKNIEIDSINKHDIVFLKNKGGLGFRLEGVIKSIKKNNVTILIRLIYCLNNNDKIESGKTYDKYINKEIEMHVSKIHRE